MIKSEAVSKKRTLFQRISYSIFPSFVRSTPDQKSYRLFFNSLILHFRPRKVPERTLRLTLSWGLGGMAAVLVFLLFGTGMLLKFYYEPFPGKAYESILYLQDQVLFGKLIRNIHHWSGHGLLIVVFLHFLRVFFSGAFYAPRQFNWVIGLGLFLTVLFSNLTGYLMPWDQLAYWAVTISTGMLEYMPVFGEWLKKLIQGGGEMGPATLTNFYAIHTAALPALLLVLMPFHFWRVRKAGGLVIPHKPEESPDNRGESIESFPNLILREVVVALVLVAVMLMIAIFFNTPLETKANPGLSPNPTKAPWYFAAFQEMLMHFHPLFALFIIPVLMLVFLILIPYINYQSQPAGVWFGSLKGRKMALVAAIIALVMTLGGLLIDEYFNDLTNWLPGMPAPFSSGLIPFLFILAGVFVFYILIKRKYMATRNETVQAVFVLLLTTFLIFMVINIWFRGPGMKLMWPWQVIITGV